MTNEPTPGAPYPNAALEALRLLHELQVHQVELSEQNATLEATRAELSESLRRYMALYEEAPVGLVTVDRRGFVAEANRCACELLGGSLEALVGRSLLDRVAASDRDRLWLVIAGDLSQPGEREAEVRREGPDAAWLRVQMRPPLSTDSHILLALTDVTAQRLAEADRIARESAELANRSKSAFLSRVSHELRTPLNAVLGFSHLLQRNEALGAMPAALRQLAHIHAAGRHLLAMVDDVLDLSRIESGQMALNLETVAVGPLAAECVALLAMLARQQDVALTLRGERDGHLARADPTRLRQVLTNLVSNAVKYNHTGGHVELDITADGAAVAVAVHDDGPGLSAAQLAALFQPFNRLGAEVTKVEGTGLGLVISRQLLGAMGGTLEVRSEPGQGSVFTARLPLCAVPGHAGGADVTLQPAVPAAAATSG